MKKSKMYFKICAAILAILLTVPFLSSCTQNKTVVGTVNGDDVYYDELYFLVSNYKSSVAEKCNNDPVLMQTELDRLIKENIITNYAKLALCEKWGLKYEDISDEDIDNELEAYIQENFNGDSDEFEDNCKEFGLSERYVRYTLGLDLLCEQLPAKYAENGLVYSEETDIINYIKENFIRVNHLVLFNDNGDDVNANEQKIREAKTLLDSGENINSLIGRGYSEDFGDPDASGYYICKGTMTDEYEQAAFALEIGEYSDVISAYSENNNGEYVSCFYVIQRLEMSDEYIDEYYMSLKNDYYNSVINEDLQELRKTLKFEPNDRYNKLDLTDLPKTSNMTAVIIISAIVAVAVIAVVTVIVIKQIHKKKNISYKAKTDRRK
ncbi:MAG: hypothetical protein IJ011_08655 [Clostridia bacterium]|nr:hypothetical protein [Clostridia bacterium]